MNRERLRFLCWAALALAAGLVLRLWFIRHEPRIAGDTFLYGEIAKNWLVHGVYGFSVDGANAGEAQLRPTLIRLPGYPIFVAVCFRLFGMEHYLAIMRAQAAVDLATCCLCSALAGRLFGSRATLPVLWFASLCPFTAGYVAAPLTETLSLFCVAAAFYALERWQASGADYNRWLWAVAAALAYAVLLRPEQGLLAAAIVPAMVWIALATPARRALLVRSATPVLVASVLVLLPLVPWAIRNHRTFGVIQPLAPRSAADPGEFVPHGFGRWFRTWAIDFASTEPVYWPYNGDPIHLKDISSRAFDRGPWRRGISQDLYTRTAALLDDYNVTDNATPQIDARFGALAEERIRAAPLRFYLLLPVARTLDMAFRPRTEMMPIPSEWWRPTTRPALALIAISLGLLNLAYFAAALAGLRRWRHMAGSLPPIAWAMISSIVLRCALLLTLDNSEPRYTLEFFPVLLVWCAACFSPIHKANNES